MNLRLEFELVLVAALMNRVESLDLDTCVQEILREEIQLKSHNTLNEEPMAFVAPSCETLALISMEG